MTNDLAENYLYPEQMLPYIKDRWYKVAFPHATKKEIPSDKNILQLLNTAFHASLSTQERRLTKVRIALCEPEELLNDVKLRRRNRPIRFNNPRRYSSSEIVQLAPAVDPRQLIIGVRPINDGDQSVISQTLEIWGLVDAGHSWWEFTRGERQGLLGVLGGSPPPDGLTISIMSPGGLVVSRAGIPIVSLEKGKVILPLIGVFNSGPIGDNLNSMYSKFHDYICMSMGTEKWDSKSKWENYPQYFLKEFIQRILLRVRELGHGGAILIIPDDWAISDNRLQDRVDIKYPSIDKEIWSLLVECVSLNRKHSDKLLPAYDLKDVSHDLFREINSFEIQYENTLDLVRDRANLIASLTNVDGSVVITNKLGLLGFGAEVIAQSPALHHIKVAMDVDGNLGNMRPITDYGTRHRSAFRFCSSHEGLIAFVVSQDGDIRVIKRVGSELILWSGILGESVLF